MVHVVAAADVDRVDAELARDDIEHALAEEVAGRPRPAVRDVRSLLLKTAVWRAEMASILVGPWNEPLSDIT